MSVITITVRQKITHPKTPQIATIEAAFPEVPQAGDTLVLPGVTADVKCRQMQRNLPEIVVWLENENRAYKAKVFTIEQVMEKRLECGWTLTDA